MKKLIWVLLAIAYTLAAFPQQKNQMHQQHRSQHGKSDANIVGHILNKLTKEHIPFVTISLRGTTHATSTDETGHYYLKDLPKGNFMLVASGVGYKSEENSITLEENTNSVTLAQGLNFQPGLRIESNCQNCGFQQVRINGLDGPYSQILIDSRPIFSALAGVYGIEQIPANMIERVEVMRGGGSALFGSNAIAGTINIITKAPKTNILSVSNVTNIIGGKSPDNNLSFHASLVSNDFKAGMLVFASNRQREALDYDGDGFTEIGKLEGSNMDNLSTAKAIMERKKTRTLTVPPPITV